MRVYDVSNTMGHVESTDHGESATVVSRAIDFVDPDVRNSENELLERVWQMYSAGRLVKEISAELNVNRNRIVRLLKEAAAIHGETFVDGRTRRANLSKKHLEPPLFQAIAPRVMEMFHRGELYATIASTLQIDINTIRKTVVWWHETNGLPPPDGRTRRQGLEVKSRK